MIEELKQSPLMTAVTGVATALSILNSTAVSLAVQPIFADLISLVLLLACILYWLRQSPPEAQPTTSTLVDPAGLPVTRREPSGPRPRLPRFLLALPLAALFIWGVRGPVVHAAKLAVNGRWTICGEFQSSCGRAVCLDFFDARGRQILGPCTRVQDDSGYLFLKASSILDYQPQSVAVSCGGQESPKMELPEACFSRACSGHVRLP
jgi:hypothetical protein